MVCDGKKNKFTFLEKKYSITFVAASNEIILHYNYPPRRRKSLVKVKLLFIYYKKYIQ